ncbi:imidazoleglycerol-phosphate dehydratase HisB [Desulfoluna sp.]|uniref:imidazoleglycerol-phosphate dehydratase HisB n=1 Tax=Desulfoluna sp. TaxID=2045199 RepID=UPI00261B7204|nr:imidazoleglycerol-phosphate dehydratase HisB [Desulfoluna sp.]
MTRTATITRNTQETRISIDLDLDGRGRADVKTGIPYFDHMLTLFAAHGFFDLTLKADGDLEIDAHHTVEDTGLALGMAIADALGDRAGIRRYGLAVTPMDETLAEVALDLSNRPYLVYNFPDHRVRDGNFDAWLAQEFFQALSVKAGMNLHINVRYGTNDHHIIEGVFKSLGRALDQAVSIDPRIEGVRSTKGVI